MEDVEMYYIEKIKKHLCNWIDYAKEHLLRILFIPLFLLVCCYVFTLFPKTATNDEQNILIFGITLSNWSTWLGILAIASTGVWAFYEYDKSRIASKQQKASEIAKIFSDSLLKKCSTLITVYENTPIDHLLKQIDDINSPFKHFTTDELREITNNDDFPSLYKKNKEKIDFDYIYFRVLESRINIDSEYEEKYNEIDNDEKNQHRYTTNEARELFVLVNETFPFHFSNLVDEVLNKLEYICMNISSHAAGSTFIYQSLHQIFFDTVKTLAFEICIRNDGKYSDKFYTNIIHVYNEWQKIYQKSIKNEIQKKNQNKRILNPKIKTVE